MNVGANALPWLKRFTLSGKDLPDLHRKIGDKLLTYMPRTSDDIRDVTEELGYLGTLLGNDIKQDGTTTGYFLLLGQSLSLSLMPSKAKQTNEQVDGEETV
ncbi:MAG: hypothetical protein LC781_04610 [Actinobacteria bacterium]|nr:hypothetical protein [Actinomycetota bacterium]